MTDIRRMLDTARTLDRPTGVDREALLQKILAAPPPSPPRDGLWVAAGGALALAAVVGLLAWPDAPAKPPPPAPAVASAAPIVAAVEHPAAVVAAPVVMAAPVVTPTVAPVVTARRAAAPVRTEGDEWQIIRDADQSLRAHAPDRALAVLARHAVAFPRGVATPEVLAYRVRAYCMAGRTAEALAVARELRTRAPTSPAAYSLRATCAAEP